MPYQNEVQVAATGTSPGFPSAVFSSPRPYDVLAAKNATLRLRAPSGHVFSFTDLTSAHGAVNFGHLNPAIDPFTGLASDLATGFYPPAAASYAEWLCGKLHMETHNVLYRVGGNSAVGAAIGMAQQARKGKILVIDGASHGLGRKARSYRGTDSFVSIAVGREFNAWDGVSCLVYEPILGGNGGNGANGLVPVPLPWLRGLSQSAQDAGVIVIADEIQCGFFRFGKLSLAMSEYLHPDMYLFGNSMTNGIYPLSAVVCPKTLDGGVLAGDEGGELIFQTATLGYQAAECVAKYIDSTDIEGQVEQIHLALGKVGERLAANPRLSSFHLAGPTLSLEVLDGKAMDLVHACEERCVLVGVGGGRVRLAPPTTIPMEQLTSALKIVEQAAAGL
jgi:acetylornithine/succinyldiaminopimelate/putrescine aminotransferase